MGAYRRTDSKYWWIFLESTKARFATDIPVGTTKAQIRDSERLANDRYHEESLKRGPRTKVQPITFAKHAEWFANTVIPTYKHGNRERDKLGAFLGGPHWVAPDRPPRGMTQARVRELLDIARKGLGPLLVCDIDAQHVLDWRTARMTIHRVGSGQKNAGQVYPIPANRTINVEVELIQRMLNRAKPRYRALGQVLQIVPLEVLKRKKRFMMADEESRLLAAFRPDDRAFFLIGIDCLVRLGDIGDLKWTDDFGTFLRVRDPKESNEYDVVISPRVREALDALERTSPYMFPRRRTGTIYGTKPRESAMGPIMRNVLEAACKRAGVPYGRKHDGITFHWATRRTGATKLLRAGGEKVVGTVAAMGGWKDATILLKEYEEVTLAEQQIAMQNLHGVAPDSTTAKPPKKKPARATLDRARAIDRRHSRIIHVSPKIPRLS